MVFGTCVYPNKNLRYMGNFANFVAELRAFCAAIPYYLLFVEILKIDFII